jgi:tetratricopeptide (TPR) repeat protein
LRNQWAIIISILAISGFSPIGAAFAGVVDDAVAAAKKDADEGRCADALERLVGIEGFESRAHLMAAECEIRESRYAEALAQLDPIVGANDLSRAQQGDVELYRGVSLYHLERFTEASSALDKARGATRHEAQLNLYIGLLALRAGDNDRAAPALERAARLSPMLTEPVASYYAGLAWQQSAERKKARAAFQRVIDIDGDGPWGLEAARLLETTEIFPYYVRVSAGIEYDDNVILRGGVTQFAADSSSVIDRGQKDWRGVWAMDAGVQLFQVGKWSGGVTASYAGDAYFELTEFDSHFPTIGDYVAYQVDPDTLVQGRYQYGYGWVDEKSFISSHTAEISMTHTWERAGTTVVLADAASDDLRYQIEPVPNGNPPPPPAGGPGSTCPGGPFATGCAPAGLNSGHERDRDGWGVGGAINHRYLVPVPPVVDEIFESIEVGGGYRFLYFDSQGDEWKHMSHIGSLAMDLEFPFDISLGTLVSYEYRDFSNPSTYPDAEIANQEYALSSQDRQEHVLVYSAEIEKDLNEYFSVSTRWTYTDNESNRRVYDYSNHIVGAYVNFRFD